MLMLRFMVTSESILSSLLISKKILPFSIHPELLNPVSKLLVILHSLTCTHENVAR